MAAAGPRARKKRKSRGHRKQPDERAAKFGQRLRALRKNANFNFDAFVEETGLGRGYISELERGMAVPTLTTLSKLSAALELTIADLVVDDSPRGKLYELTGALQDSDVRGLVATAEKLAAKKSR